MNCHSRPWLDTRLNNFTKSIVTNYQYQTGSELVSSIYALAEQSRDIHEQQCLNLNPATNIMNPKAEALLAKGMGSRPSLGHPGDKYEMGLEAIEQVEVIANTLACEVFNCRFAEIRVGSGALANLYAFMATCKARDTVLVPPAAIGGHVTHHNNGAAGLFGLSIIEAKPDSSRYSVNLDSLRKQVHLYKPKLITIGGSLNLLPHPVADIRAIADEVGAYVLFDAAHQCGMIAGKHWPNPLDEGAHLMTMSTYKSLGGPPGGLLVSNDESLMESIDAIAFPGLTANFDAGKSAALAVSLLDWIEHGQRYASAMVSTAQALAEECQAQRLPVFTVTGEKGKHLATYSHQFAIEATRYGGGQKMAKQLRQANILTCGIGLPLPLVEGDMNGLRIGTPEIVRAGFTEKEMPQVAALIADSLMERRPVAEIAAEASTMRSQFTTLHYVN